MKTSDLSSQWIKEKASELGIDMIGIVPAKAIDEYSDIWVE